jgi:sec-independent protein translocase protein TatB
MLDIGWSELLVIAVVLIVVVGPKDLPPMLRAFGKMTSRLRKTAGEFRAQFDDALREADMDDLRQTIGDAQKLNPANALREAMNPLRQMGADIKADLQRATHVDHFPEADVSGIAASDQPLVPMTSSDLPPLGTIGEPDAALFVPKAATVAASPAAASEPAKVTAAKPRVRKAKVADVASEEVAKPARAKRAVAAKPQSSEKSSETVVVKAKPAARKKPAAKKTVVATPEGKDEA